MLYKNKISIGLFATIPYVSPKSRELAKFLEFCVINSAYTLVPKNTFIQCFPLNKIVQYD